MAQKTPTNDSWLPGILGLVFAVMFYLAIRYWTFSKSIAEWAFSPRSADYVYIQGTRWRKIRSFCGLIAAILIYFVWQWGEDFSEPLVTSIFLGPIIGFAKLGACCLVAMLIIVASARYGHRIRMLGRMGIPALIIVGFTVGGLLILKYGKALLPLNYAWPQQNTGLGILAFTIQAFLILSLVAIWLAGLPASHEHCFRARDSHIGLAPLTLIVYALFLTVQSIIKISNGDLPAGVPHWAALAMLFGGPLAIAAISIGEFIALSRQGADFRSASYEVG